MLIASENESYKHCTAKCIDTFHQNASNTQKKITTTKRN